MYQLPSMHRVDDVANSKRVSGDLLMILVSTDRMKDHCCTLQVVTTSPVSVNGSLPRKARNVPIGISWSSYFPPCFASFSGVIRRSSGMTEGCYELCLME